MSVPTTSIEPEASSSYVSSNDRPYSNKASSALRTRPRKPKSSVTPNFRYSEQLSSNLYTFDESMTDINYSPSLASTDYAVLATAYSSPQRCIISGKAQPKLKWYHLIPRRQVVASALMLQLHNLKIIPESMGVASYLNVLPISTSWYKSFRDQHWTVYPSEAVLQTIIQIEEDQMLRREEEINKQQPDPGRQAYERAYRHLASTNKFNVEYVSPTTSAGKEMGIVQMDLRRQCDLVVSPLLVIYLRTGSLAGANLTPEVQRLLTLGTYIIELWRSHPSSWRTLERPSNLAPLPSTNLSLPPRSESLTPKQSLTKTPSRPASPAPIVTNPLPELYTNGTTFTKYGYGGHYSANEICYLYHNIDLGGPIFHFPQTDAGMDEEERLKLGTFDTSDALSSAMKCWVIHGSVKRSYSAMGTVPVVPKVPLISAMDSGSVVDSDASSTVHERMSEDTERYSDVSKDTSLQSTDQKN